MDGSREGSRGLCQYWAPEPDAQFGILGVFLERFLGELCRTEAEGGRRTVVGSAIFGVVRASAANKF